MALTKRRCEICGHETRLIVGCGRDDCDYRTSDKPHDHCSEQEEGRHGVCTAIGCQSVTEPLGLVNPAIGAPPRPDPVPAPNDTSLLWQVRLARRTPQSQVADRAIANPFEAELLMFVLTGEKQRVEPIDPADLSTGLWLVTLPAAQADALQSTGRLLVERDVYYLEAELP